MISIQKYSTLQKKMSNGTMFSQLSALNDPRPLLAHVYR